MEVTSTRIRILKGQKYVAIASITLDEQLIINDIKVERNGKGYNIIFPRSSFASLNGQSNIVATKELQKKIQQSIVHKMQSQADNLST